MKHAYSGCCWLPICPAIEPCADLCSTHSIPTRTPRQQRDTESTSAADTVATSYAFFEETLLKHCVERVPYNIKVFDETDVPKVVDFAVESYYRQFRLFNYIFGSVKRLQLKQVLPNEVEAPPAQLPLSAALKFAAQA